MKKTLILICLMIFMISGCSAKTLETEPHEFEAFTVQLPKNWVQGNDKPLYSWIQEDAESMILINVGRKYFSSTLIGTQGTFSEEILNKLFKLNYDQRQYGKDDFSTEKKNITIKGMEEVTTYRDNGVLNDVLYDIQVYTLVAPPTNEYDESLNDKQLILICCTRSDCENKKTFQTTFDKLAKSVTVDPDLYQKY